MHQISGMAVMTLFALSALAAANVGVKTNNAYVGDMYVDVVRDGRGQCVRTILWAPELALPGESRTCQEDKQSPVTSRSLVTSRWLQSS
jgi:hypothetical protein